MRSTKGSEKKQLLLHQTNMRAAMTPSEQNQANGHFMSPSTELTRIDCGISQLSSLPLISSLTVLNVHFNNIRQIHGLDHLVNLRHLDLSSNLIEKIEGLSHLTSLRTLNLASNRITVVEGLQKLESLVKLNLAYNQINDLSGFLVLRGPRYRLTSVELQGNQIRSVAVLVRCMKPLMNLRRLTVASGHQKNPLCTMKHYEQAIFSGLLQVEILDGRDKWGKEIEMDVLADIPGLDEFLDIFSTSSSASKEVLTVPNTTSKVPPQPICAAEPLPRSATPPVRLAAQRHSDDSDEAAANEQEYAKAVRAKATKPRSSSQNRSAVDEANSRKQTFRRKESSEDEQSTTETAKSEKETGRRREVKIKEEQKPSISMTVSPRPNGQSSTSGNRAAQGIEMTFGQLLRELDSERERRWKAEEACRRLSEHFKSMQVKLTDDTALQSAALSATANLRENLMMEKERATKLVDECAALQAQVKQLKEDKNHIEEEAEKLRISLTGSERARDETVGHLTSKLRHMEVQLETSDHLLLQLKADTANQRDERERLTNEIKDLQNLLVNKEKEFQHELERRYTIDSPQLQEYMQRQVASTEQQASLRCQLLERNVEESKRKYKELEDEFRMALRIEAGRYENLQKSYKATKTNLEKVSQELRTTMQREAESKTLIPELAQLVKEQKFKLGEVTNVKSEMDRVYKERTGTLELHLEEARKRMLQLEMLKQENKKLVGQIEAQGSVIEGLRSERRLWSEELAQQGSALAQDRGRLESKIESLQSEVMTLKIQLERETDCVKIKAKLIEDQTETIRKLREGLTEKDALVRKLQSEALQSHGNIEKDLHQEKKLNDDLKSRLSEALERREAMKMEMEELQRELAVSQTSYETLQRKHRDRAALIDKLESQTMELKNIMEDKATRLTQERDEARAEVKSLEKKLSQLDVAFREQLQAAEQSRTDAVSTTRRELNLELQKAHARIREVEQEMRDLLIETQQSKKLLEEKVQRLTAAFQDLSGDLRR